MPDAHQSGRRTPAQREADHASLARLSDTLVPALVAKLAGSGLGELEVREGDWSIRLRRPVGGTTPIAAAARRSERPRLGSHPAPVEARQGTARGAQPAADPAPDPHRALATSPAVGVFRPGIAIGSRVQAGDRIAIVDLLGIPQDVVAPIDGTLVELFVQAGEAVEYGEEVGVIQDDPDPGPAAGEDASDPGDPGDPGEAPARGA